MVTNRCSIVRIRSTWPKRVECSALAPYMYAIGADMAVPVCKYHHEELRDTFNA